MECQTNDANHSGGLNGADNCAFVRWREVSARRRRWVIIHIMLRTKWQSRVLAKQAFLANLCASGDFGRVLYDGGREKSCTLVHTLLGKYNMGERLCVAFWPTHTYVPVDCLHLFLQPPERTIHQLHCKQYVMDKCWVFELFLILLQIFDLNAFPRYFLLL